MSPKWVSIWVFIDGIILIYIYILHCYKSVLSWPLLFKNNGCSNNYLVISQSYRFFHKYRLQQHFLCCCKSFNENNFWENLITKITFEVKVNILTLVEITVLMLTQLGLFWNFNKLGKKTPPFCADQLLKLKYHKN